MIADARGLRETGARLCRKGRGRDGFSRNAKGPVGPGVETEGDKGESLRHGYVYDRHTMETRLWDQTGDLLYRSG